MTQPLLMAVAGTSEFQLGFELAGVKQFVNLDDKTPEQTYATLREAFHDHTIGIIIVEEECLAGIPVADRLILENSVRPVIVTLRREPGDSGLLRRQIMRAIGVDLLGQQTRAETEEE